MPSLSRRRSKDSSSSDNDHPNKYPHGDKRHEGELPADAFPSMGYASNPTAQAPFMPQMPSEYNSNPSFPIPQADAAAHDRSIVPPSSPPAYTAPPPSGYRLPLTTTAAFPAPNEAGHPPCYDLDGVSPVYIGSALFGRSVQPCKIAAHLSPSFVAVPYAGGEVYHHGRFDLLPFTPDTMELVRASHGRIPPGRRPIEGGYEENGAKLYHGIALVGGVRIPGKVGEHLGACHVAFGGAEHIVTENYELLCWR